MMMVREYVYINVIEEPNSFVASNTILGSLTSYTQRRHRARDAVRPGMKAGAAQRWKAAERWSLIKPSIFFKMKGFPALFA